MLGEIDLNARPQKPQLFLCLPDRTTIAKLTEAYDIKQSLKLSGIDELSFSIPFDIDKQHEIIHNPHVDMLKERYLVKFVLGDRLEQYYRVEKPIDTMDDSGNIKRVECYLLAIELKDKQIRAYKKDAINAQTALTDALSNSIWNIGYIDADYLLTYRSFDVSKATALDFIFQVATTFNALVLFNAVDRTVELYKPKNIGQNTGLKVSYGKYLKSLNRESDAGQIVTRLKVFGKDDLSIQRVNPTGANYVEDFSYFMYPFQRDVSRNVISHSYYMSDGLCHELLDYNALLATKDGEFAPLLTQKNSLVDTKTTKENELATLNTELKNIQAQIDLEQSIGHPVTNLLTQQSAKQTQINAKQTEIDSVISQIASIDSQIVTLQSSVSIANNFTVAQIQELNQFIIEDEWSDENYIKDTDLYTEAKKKILEINKPPLVINIDIVNFNEIVTEQRNWDKLNLGDTMTIVYEKFNLNAQAKIIAMEFDYDEGNVNLTIADAQQVLDDQAKFLKTLYSSISTSTSVDMNKFKWNGIETTQNDVSKLLNETWDASLRAINGGVNESVVVDRRGITLTDSTDPLKGIRMTHGVIGLSNDGFNSLGVALDGSGVYAEKLIGKIIAGEKLLIENSSGSFTVDSNGATLTDADLAITRSDGKTRILASPNDGFKVQKLQGSTWIDKLYADFDGNLTVEDLITKRILIKDTDDNVLIDGDNKIIDFSKFTTILGNISMDNLSLKGAITWDVSGLNGLIPPSASQVGARSNGWLPNASEIGAIAATQTAVFNTLTNNGQSLGLFMENDQLYINASYLKSGTIAANLIDTTNLKASKIYNTADESDYAVVGGANGGLLLYRSGDPLFEIYGGLEGLTMKATGLSFLSSTGTTTYAQRIWDFTTATSVKFDPASVTGLVSEAVFG